MFLGCKHERAALELHRSILVASNAAGNLSFPYEPWRGSATADQMERIQLESASSAVVAEQSAVGLSPTMPAPSMSAPAEISLCSCKSKQCDHMKGDAQGAPVYHSTLDLEKGYAWMTGAHVSKTKIERVKEVFSNALKNNTVAVIPGESILPASVLFVAYL